jgi:hypothetical protein
LLFRGDASQRNAPRSRKGPAVGIDRDNRLVRVELKNYRAFEDTRPAAWTLRDGFVAFVGVNNSGKSSLLRFFHEARGAFTQFGNAQFQPTLEAFRGQPLDFSFQSVADVEEVFCNRNGRDMTATFSLPDPVPSEEVGLEPVAVRFRWQRPGARLTFELLVGAGTLIVDNLENEGMSAAARLGDSLMQIDLRRYQAAFADLARAIYLGPFRNAVNMGGSASYYDLQIGEQFIAAWDGFKTGNNRAQNRAAIAVEKELQKIFSLDRLEINAAPGNATLQVIADDEPYQLQEQGAGFAQFIVVMAFVATRRPSYILIDEPDLNLHPSLQLDFLTTLAKYCDRGVTFATHSIGLARSVGEEIYSVRRAPDGGREVSPLAGGDSYVELLGELGFSGYSELGFSKVLLVEGTSEVPTIQSWLRLYGIEHEVVLLPLGRSSLINATSGTALAEIKRITESVAVLIDSERSAAEEELAGDRQGFVEACRELGFEIHVLERRALENYLTQAAIKAVKGDKYQALGPFEALADARPAWGKNENWRIAAEMRADDLADTDLGRFLSQLADG